MKPKFSKAIRQNRKKLKEAGFAPSTLHSWEYGLRHPRIDNAKRLSLIIGMDLSEIPYIKMEINE